MPPSAVQPTPVGVNAAVLVKEIDRLLQAKLYRSAYILANFLLPAHTPFQLSLAPALALTKHSSTASPSAALRFHLFADSLNNGQLREYRRALAYYQYALDALTAAPATNDVSAATVKVHMVDAYLAIDDDDSAISLMAQLVAAQPCPLRVDQLSALASLYRSHNKHSEAVHVYRQILHVEPYAVDALVAIMQITDGDPRVMFPPAVDAIHPSVHSYLLAVLSSSSSAELSNIPSAIRTLSAVCSAHPLSAWLWTEKAAVQQQWYDDSVSVATLEHAHTVDGRLLDGMDRMALLWLLEGGAKARQLGRLQHALLAADETRSEGWLVAAMAATQAGSKERCERYLEKAHHINEQHINAHLVKAQLALHANTLLPTNPTAAPPSSTPTDSLPAFQRALNLHYTLQPAQPALHILHPMLVAHVAAGQTGRAQSTAVALHQRWKTNPRVLTLLALTLSAAAAGDVRTMEKARKCIEKAVAVDATHATALCAYADCMVAEGRVGDAVAVLRRSCGAVGGVDGGGGGGVGEGGCLWVEGVVVKLAECCAMSGDRGEATRWYLQALKINKRSVAAADGLRRVEENVQT